MNYYIGLWIAGLSLDFGVNSQETKSRWVQGQRDKGSLNILKDNGSLDIIKDKGSLDKLKDKGSSDILKDKGSLDIIKYKFRYS